MFFSHMPELLAVLLVGFLIFGPKRLPELGSALGQTIRDFKKGVSHIEQSASVTPPTTSDSE